MVPQYLNKKNLSKLPIDTTNLKNKIQKWYRNVQK